MRRSNDRLVVVWQNTARCRTLLKATSVQVRVAEVVEMRVQHGRDSDVWLGGLILKRANSPPRITARRGGGVTKKMVRSLLMGAAGVVFLVPSIGTPPRPREKRMLRNIFLIARPPLLAVMRGGGFAILKIVPTLDSSVDPTRHSR